MTPNLAKVIEVVGTLAASYYGCAVLIMIVLEIAAEVTGRRARTLRRHLGFLFGRRLAERILENPLVRKVDENEVRHRRNRYRDLAAKVKSAEVPIAYIDPRDFALALMEEAFEKEETREKTRVRELKKQNGLPQHARDLLETLLQGTNRNPAHIQERIEGWFRRDQLQVSASYSARSRVWGFLAGAALAWLAGLDTIAIAFHDINSSQFCCLLRGISAAHTCWSSVPGCLISGLMISQGASFWFDILGQVTDVRSEGSRPK